jgi:hypothetical protein
MANFYVSQQNWFLENSRKKIRLILFHSVFDAKSQKKDIFEDKELWEKIITSKNQINRL